DLGVGTATLLACCQRLSVAVPELARALRDLAQEGIEPAHAADVLGAALVREPDERQALLEVRDVSERLARVTSTAAALVAALANPAPAHIYSLISLEWRLRRGAPRVHTAASVLASAVIVSTDPPGSVARGAHAL